MIKSLYRNSTIAPYVACNEKDIVPFVREVLRVAWAMISLDPPIDLPAALEGDVINDTRYRRTYDSEFSATTIDYFVWPALIRERKVVAKGEVVTRRISPQKTKKVCREFLKMPFFYLLSIFRISFHGCIVDKKSRLPCMGVNVSNVIQ